MLCINTRLYCARGSHACNNNTGRGRGATSENYSSYSATSKACDSANSSSNGYVFPMYLAVLDIGLYCTCNSTNRNTGQRCNYQECDISISVNIRNRIPDPIHI